MLCQEDIMRLKKPMLSFHPESILTLQDDIGMKLIYNLVSGLPVRPRERVSRAVLA